MPEETVTSSLSPHLESTVLPTNVRSHKGAKGVENKSEDKLVGSNIIWAESALLKEHLLSYHP